MRVKIAHHWIADLQLASLVVLALEGGCLLGCLLLGLLLASPGLAKFLEFSGIALWSVLLHGDMCVQVVQGSVALFAVSPVADIQTLNLVKSAARPFFRVHPRDWNKGVDFVSSLAVINTVKACIGEPSSSLRLLLRCSNLLKGRRIRSIVGGHLRGMGLRRRLESHGIHITNQRRRTDHSMDWDCIGTNHATVSKRTANQRAGSRVLGAGQAVHHQARASIDRGHKGVCDAPAVGLVNRNV